MKTTMPPKDDIYILREHDGKFEFYKVVKPDGKDVPGTLYGKLEEMIREMDYED